MSMSSLQLDLVELPEGQITITPHRDGWYLVQIGRARKTKRFNLTAADAAELVRVIRDSGILPPGE